MIPKECKRLAEVYFPIAGVSKHSARKKSSQNAATSAIGSMEARVLPAARRFKDLGNATKIY